MCSLNKLKVLGQVNYSLSFDKSRLSIRCQLQIPMFLSVKSRKFMYLCIKYIFLDELLYLTAEGTKNSLYLIGIKLSMIHNLLFLTNKLWFLIWKRKISFNMFELKLNFKNESIQLLFKSQFGRLINSTKQL